MNWTVFFTVFAIGFGAYLTVLAVAILNGDYRTGGLILRIQLLALIPVIAAFFGIGAGL